MKSQIQTLKESPEWEAICLILGSVRPPPALTISEWADQKRQLSPESSAEPGQFYTERAEYQRGIMDALSDPSVEELIAMTSAQIGKTTVLENIIGYYVDQDPSPILQVQPTLDMAKVFSNDRLAPMLRDTPCLKGLVKDSRTRDAQNKILHKAFPGGFIAIAGANSPASLASRPVRVVLQDEVDRYPYSAGKEGDPCDLADKRCTAWWNRKKIKTSTPTVKHYSRIEKAFLESDMRRYWVPCPQCGEFQVLKWDQVKWPKDDKGKHKPKDAFYECEFCRAHLSDADKIRMVRDGEWRAEGEFTGTAGFHLNELYSPWVSFAETVANFLKAKRGGRETLKVWVNTSLGKTWEEEADTVPDQPLYNRREQYGPQIPERGCVLTAGVDVQDDRLECQVVAWGPGFESWAMDYRIFRGDTVHDEPWNELDEYIQRPLDHVLGVSLYISCVFLDAFGHRTEKAYQFVKPRQVRKIFACKGSNQPAEPIVGRPSKKNVARVDLYPVGTDTAKDMLFGRLKNKEPGPEYVHFPISPAFDEEYFKQLTSEKVSTRYKFGKPIRVWELKPGQRNEVLDTMVYSMAALALLRPNFEQILTMIQGQARAVKDRPGIAINQPPSVQRTGRRVISKGVEI